MKIVGIYAIAVSRPDGSVAHYVGQSRDIKQRLRSHRYYLARGEHTNAHLQSAWLRYGEGAFSFRVVEPVEGDADALTAAEERWIAELDARWDRGGFNQRIVANSNHGLRKPAEAVARSNAHRKGKPLSPEHRAAIGAANRGRKPSAEAVRKAIEARTSKPSPLRGRPHPCRGKPMSEEARARVSEGLRKSWAKRKADRAASAITYHSEFGQVARNTVTPDMLAA